MSMSSSGNGRTVLAIAGSNEVSGRFASLTPEDIFSESRQQTTIFLLLLWFHHSLLTESVKFEDHFHGECNNILSFRDPTQLSESRYNENSNRKQSPVKTKNATRGLDN